MDDDELLHNLLTLLLDGRSPDRRERIVLATLQGMLDCHGLPGTGARPGKVRSADFRAMAAWSLIYAERVVAALDRGQIVRVG